MRHRIAQAMPELTAPSFGADRSRRAALGGRSLASYQHPLVPGRREPGCRVSPSPGVIPIADQRVQFIIDHAIAGILIGVERQRLLPAEWFDEMRRIRLSYGTDSRSE